MNLLRLIVALILLGLITTYAFAFTPLFYARIEYAAGDCPISVFTTDVDGDGASDLVTTNTCSNDISILLNNGDGTFAAAVNYPAGIYPCSISSADFDGDGDNDLAVANAISDNVSIFLNNGDGTFATAVNYTVGDYPYSVCTNDFDGDGDSDLAIANYNSSNVSILQNNGDGTFAATINYAAGSGPYSVCTTDLDGDGDSDLAVVNQYSDNVSILQNNGDGTFATPVNYGVGEWPTLVCTADFDGDGDSDLAVANADSGDISILLNNGDGTFAVAANYGAGNRPYSVCAIDLDGDSDNDLAVANTNSDNVSILLNNGGGTFATAVHYAANDEARAVYAADFDNDGDNDLAVSNFASDNVTILRNNGDGTFAAAVNYWAGNAPLSVCASDLDSDGDVDLAMPNNATDNVSVLLGNGDGTFVAAMYYAAGDSPYSVCASDLDSDGDVDLAVANLSSDNVSILLGNGDGTFAAAMNYGAGDGPFSVCASDLDCNGDVDLAVTNRYSNNVSILLGNGDGTFATAVNYHTGDEPRLVFASDLDSDGDIDLAVANSGWDNVSILLGNGDGTFAVAVNYIVGDGPSSVCASDLDFDGNVDLAVPNVYSDNVSILFGNGDGTFAAAVNYIVGDGPSSVCASDLDFDGNVDLVVANAYSDNVSILLGNGDGTFVAAMNYGAGNLPRSVCASDLDSDGDVDLAVANYYSMNVSILINILDGSYPGQHSCALNEISLYEYGKGTLTFNAWQSVGIPDGKGTPLGYEGVLELRFTGDIIDRPGPDIRVYELGHSYPQSIDENYLVEASLDGVDWTILGEGPGDVVDFDLADGSLSAARYIRITDIPPNESLAIPDYDPTVMGADIDAVVALNCANLEWDCTDAVDNDGDGFTDCQDSECLVDADQDGYYALPCGNDCNDVDENMNPGLTEMCKDGKDNDCDGIADPDDICGWFVRQAGGAADPEHKFDIVIAADVSMPEDYFEMDLVADIWAIQDAFRTLPGITDDVMENVTFWRCVREVHTNSIVFPPPIGTQERHLELMEEAADQKFDAVLVRALSMGNNTLLGLGVTPYSEAVVADDPQDPERVFVALHELGHAAFRLGDEYWGEGCSGSSTARDCRIRAANTCPSEPPSNVWRTKDDCEADSIAYAYTYPCFKFCEFEEDGAVAWRLGGSNENPNLMRAECEDYGTIGVNGYGEAGNRRMLEAIQAVVDGQTNTCETPFMQVLAELSPTHRKLTLYLELGPSMAFVDSLVIETGKPVEIAPSPRPIYIDVFDHEGTNVAHRADWDPRYLSIHDFEPVEVAIPVSFEIDHPLNGQRWRVMDMDSMVLGQGSLGASFLEYTHRINFTDPDCWLTDSDGDEIPDVFDNCPSTANPEQIDTDGDGIGDVCESTSDDEILPPPLPTSLALKTIYPNPFNPHTTIIFDLPRRTHVHLAIYDVRGALVKTLLDGFEPAGETLITWNGLNEHGDRVSSGVYFCRLKMGAEMVSKKLVILR